MPVLLNGKIPIDGGRNMSDGNRIFGDGKTLDGFLTGLLFGSLVGIFQNILLSIPEVQITLQIQPLGWTFPVLMALGALSGDIFASFIKRRVGVPRGRPIPGVDQLDFIIGAIFFISIVWIPEWEILFVWLAFTPWIHLGTNFLAYILGLKPKPY